jgi:AraC family transcriptional regulator
MTQPITPAPVREQPVPIEYGSQRFRQREVGPYQITHVRLGPESRIEPHYHERPNVGIMLSGCFDLAFTGHAATSCEPGVLFVEPAGETHCNCIGCHGAWVLAIQPDPAELDGLLPATGLLNAPGIVRAGQNMWLARRLTRELGSSDCFSGLLIEGLAAELLALAGRLRRTTERGITGPRWLTEVEQRVESSGPERISLGELARDAGVSVALLTRLFRARYGKSPGRYLLERRLDWAANQLLHSRRSIVDIACQAGFADQSHFTRRFRDYTGQTPARYRSSRLP